MFEKSRYKAENFRDPETASLAWAIASSPLMSEDTPGYEMLSENWCIHQYNLHHEWLMNLDAHPETLHSWLQEDGQKLLGKRFESLLTFWFTRSPYFEIVIKNTVIHEGKNTVGEIDFIIHSKEDDEILHIESACKYYLGTQNRSTWQHWIGPNGHDSLDAKMMKLKQQIAVFRKKESRRILSEKGIQSIRSCVFMKGYFFHHMGNIAGSVQPKHAHIHCNSGWYIRENELVMLRNTPSQWIIADRRFWMAPYHYHKSVSPTLSGNELHEFFTTRKSSDGKASMLIQVYEEGERHHEMSRGFLLPSNR